jgi:ribosome-associated protein
VDDLAVNSQLVIPSSELSEAFVRAGGPGGQHVNKTSTKVELRWNPGESAALDDTTRARLLSRLAGRLTVSGDLVVAAGDHRSQLRNREIARDRLAAIVRSALVQHKRRKKTRPSRRAVERRIKAKKQRSERKKDRRWKPE